MANLLSWRASSLFLDKQISTLQISASPTQRHILSKEYHIHFPEQAYKLQTYQFSCSTHPQRLTIIIREEVLHFWEYLWRSWLTAKIQPPRNAKGDECGQYICAIFFPTLSVGILGQTNNFMQILGVFGSLWEIFTVLLAAFLR